MLKRVSRARDKAVFHALARADKNNLAVFVILFYRIGYGYGGVYMSAGAAARHHDFHFIYLYLFFRGES